MGISDCRWARGFRSHMQGIWKFFSAQITKKKSKGQRDGRLVVLILKSDGSFI